MLFFVDGYNVTRSDPATRDLDLESQRDHLVRRLRARGGPMLGAGRIVVMFDAAQGAPTAAENTAPLTVVFTRTGTADDAIVKAVANTAEKVVVVSNDRELLERVRIHAKGPVESRPASACYEEAGKGSSRKGKKPSPRRDTGVPRGANAITEELKRIWLDKEDQ